MPSDKVKIANKGFTLIELLVVVAIISLLISIIVPALRKAKDHAKKIHCSANLRSLSMAALVYADSYGGLTPSSTNFWRAGSTTRAGWCGVTSSAAEPLPVNVQIYGNSDLTTGLARGQLWPYIESPDAWRCPADPTKQQLRSYCMSSQWWGAHTRTGDSVWYDATTTGLVYRRISQIKGPGHRFMFLDQLGNNADAYWAIYYGQPKWWNIPNYMHSGGSINGYADGHVDSYKLEAKTVTLARQAFEHVLTGSSDFFMVQDNFPDSEDLKYYQHATWGKIGW